MAKPLLARLEESGERMSWADRMLGSFIEKEATNQIHIIHFPTHCPRPPVIHVTSNMRLGGTWTVHLFTIGARSGGSWF